MPLRHAPQPVRRMRCAALLAVRPVPIRRLPVEPLSVDMAKGREADPVESYLVVGNTPVARRVCATLSAQYGAERVMHLVAPRDIDLARALRHDVAYAAVLVREDVAALRYALALAHLAPDLPLAVTIFDRTIAERLRSLLPRAVVASSASAAIPSLLGPCLGATTIAAFADLDERVEVGLDGEQGSFDERRTEFGPPSRAERLWRGLRIGYRHQDPGTRILLNGLLGLTAVLAADLMWLTVVAGHPPVEALSEAARVLATVGPGPEHPSGAYGVLSSIAMLATIVLTALFTAGLVDRMLEPRLVRLSGVGAVPRSNHVIVVGLGQVGLRLCEELRAHGCPVVAVERDRNAPAVLLARQAKIPVVFGDGTSRHLLNRLDVARCRAIAAVGSFDLDNVAVAVAASAVSPSTRVVMRAGEQEAVSETRSLLPLGITRDVTAIGAAWIVARLTDKDPGLRVIANNDEVHVRASTGTYTVVTVARRDDCAHRAADPRRAEAEVISAF